MIPVIRSEWIKAISTRLAVGLLAAVVAIVGFAVAFTLWGPEDTESGIRVEDTTGTLASQSDVVELLGVTSLLAVFVVLFGAVFTTTEWRHQTAGSSFLDEPRRWRVLAAKSVIAAVVAEIYLAVTYAVALALMLAFTRLEGIPLPLGGAVARQAGTAAVALLFSAVIGVGVGAVIRSQVGAVVAVLIWLFVIESLIDGLIPDLSRWAPFAAISAVTGDGGSDVLGPGVAVVVTALYAALALAAGIEWTERRDAL